jgi:hypothetical protein
LTPADIAHDALGPAREQGEKAQRRSAQRHCETLWNHDPKLFPPFACPV